MNNRYMSRGKRVDNGEWIEGWITTQYKKGFDGKILFTRIKSNVFGGGEHLVDTETVGQCTSLKDKNGKLMFEGDVLKFVNDDGESSFYVVVWNTSLLSWQVQEMSCYVKDDYYGFDELCEFGNTEVIGNIHDNKDLLEVER